MAEGSHSGLVRTLGKRVWGKTHREFESLTLRSDNLVSEDPSSSNPSLPADERR